jgi:ribokinase
MQRKPKITVAGSANLDLIMKVPRVPRAGETLLGGTFSTSPGGKGANQAVALSRLGAEVWFVGRIGEDPFGESMMENLEEKGVHTDYVVRDPDHYAGTCMILIDSEGDNAMVPDYGSNMHLSEADLERAEPIIRESDILLIQFVVPEATYAHLMQLAGRAGKPVIVNPAPSVPSNLDILKKAFCSTPNLVELEALAGLAGYRADAEAAEQGRASAGERIPSAEERATAAARVLRREGVDNIVVTLGRNGSLLLAGDENKHFGVYPAEQVDATGAGDGFTAGLTFSVAVGKSLEEATEFASAVAACAVSKLGAQSSYPDPEEVEKRMQSQTLDSP